MVKNIFPDSKVQKTLYHYTTRENADKILKNGFKVASAVKGDGRFTDNFDGVYFTQSDKSYWNNEELEQIAVKVNLKNPLDISSFPISENEYTPVQRVIAEKIAHIMQTKLRLLNLLFHHTLTQLALTTAYSLHGQRFMVA